MFFIRKNSSYHFFQCLPTRRHFHYDPGSIVIAAAVRTPWIPNLRQRYPLLTTEYLTAGVLETAVKQSGVPLEKVQNVYVATENNVQSTDSKNIQRFGQLLKKAEFNLVPHKDQGALKSLLRAVEDLKSNKSEIVVVGEVNLSKEATKNDKENQNHYETPETHYKLINDYLPHCKDLHMKACTEAVFDSELLPLRLLKQEGTKRQQIEINQDEFPEQLNQFVDCAAALVMTTAKNIEKYNLKPLVTIADIAVQESINRPTLLVQDFIKSMIQRTGLPINSIHQWQLNMDMQQILNLQKDFQLPGNIVNPFGYPAICNTKDFDFLLGTLSHLAHSLKCKNYGCMVSNTKENAVAVLLKKIPLTTSKTPRLTLFTKNECHLCDILLEELEYNFAGEYELEKLYIDKKENIRFLRLYRHDIPVLYLNGQFLCMHRLNNRLLRRKLDIIKEKGK